MNKLIAVILTSFCLSACSSTLENRDPTGELFPSVSGQSLDEQIVNLPGDLRGKPAVLLVAYKQRTQFDVDRWLMGFLQAGTDIRLLELPTIKGLVPSLASGWIDDGMRSGIPKEDWSVVVTLYGGAATPIVELTGNENGQNTRVIVIDGDGRIIWFDDTGYAARKVLAIGQLIANQ
ncbi:MAG: hypothetical protein AAGI27_04775 [Pseudomonadota bacterium]